MKNVFIIVALLLIGCKSEKAGEVSAQNGEPIGTMSITLEGKDYQFDAVSKLNSTATLEDGKIQYYLTEDDIPVSLNFNLHGTDILEKGSAVYSIPEANSGSAMIDLSFFNAKRDGQLTNKRIVFRKGEISVKQLSKNRLVMSFKGEGSPMRDRELSFPISGTVDITLNQ